MSIGSTYTGGRIMPPELANPNLHPSPFEDPAKKGIAFYECLFVRLCSVKPVMKTNEIKVEPKKEIKTEPTQLVNYESDGSDDSDPENPSCMAFWYGFL